MNIRIASVHFDADAKLKEFINGKLSKLSHFYDQIIGAEVILKLDSKEAENKVAEIKIEIPGNDLFAKKQSRSFEEATDQCIEALKTQILKHKEKQRK